MESLTGAYESGRIQPKNNLGIHAPRACGMRLWEDVELKRPVAHKSRGLANRVESQGP